MFFFSLVCFYFVSCLCSDFFLFFADFLFLNNLSCCCYWLKVWWHTIWNWYKTIHFLSEPSFFSLSKMFCYSPDFSISAIFFIPSLISMFFKFWFSLYGPRKDVKTMFYGRLVLAVIINTDYMHHTSLLLANQILEYLCLLGDEMAHIKKLINLLWSVWSIPPFIWLSISLSFDKGFFVSFFISPSNALGWIVSEFLIYTFFREALSSFLTGRKSSVEGCISWLLWHCILNADSTKTLSSWVTFFAFFPAVL